MKTCLLALMALASMLAFSASPTPAQDKAGEASFAYTAPAFIKELDTRVSRPAARAALAAPVWRRAALPRRGAGLRSHRRATAPSSRWCGTR